MRWSFALTQHGDLHVIQHEMPAAENLVVVDLEQRAGVYVIRAFDATALRRLLASPDITTVVRHAGPDAADELDDLLAAIHTLVERRTAKLRGDTDDEAEGYCR